MLDIAEFNAKINTVLGKNLDIFINSVKENMAINDQIATGETRDSLRKEVEVRVGTVYGAEHIKTLEDGISPHDSQKQSIFSLETGMKHWLFIKHGTTVFRNIAQPNIFNAFANQRQFGSTMYRLGQKKNVYTNEVQPTVERIMNELGEVIINTKIL